MFDKLKKSLQKAGRSKERSVEKKRHIEKEKEASPTAKRDPNREATSTCTSAATATTSATVQTDAGRGDDSSIVEQADDSRARPTSLENSITSSKPAEAMGREVGGAAPLQRATPPDYPLARASCSTPSESNAIENELSNSAPPKRLPRRFVKAEHLSTPISVGETPRETAEHSRTASVRSAVSDRSITFTAEDAAVDVTPVKHLDSDAPIMSATTDCAERGIHVEDDAPIAFCSGEAEADSQAMEEDRAATVDAAVAKLADSSDSGKTERISVDAVDGETSPAEMRVEPPRLESTSPSPTALSLPERKPLSLTSLEATVPSSKPSGVKQADSDGRGNERPPSDSIQPSKDATPPKSRALSKGGLVGCEATVTAASGDTKSPLRRARAFQREKAADPHRSIFTAENSFHSSRTSPSRSYHGDADGGGSRRSRAMNSAAVSKVPRLPEDATQGPTPPPERRQRGGTATASHKEHHREVKEHEGRISAVAHRERSPPLRREAHQNRTGRKQHFLQACSPARRQSVSSLSPHHLDGGALVQQCLREMNDSAREITVDGRRLRRSLMYHYPRDSVEEEDMEGASERRVSRRREEELARQDIGYSLVPRRTPRFSSSSSRLPGRSSPTAIHRGPSIGHVHSARSTPIQRISFYEDDDGDSDDDHYAAVAVDQPQRFRVLAERRRCSCERGHYELNASERRHRSFTRSLSGSSAEGHLRGTLPASILTKGRLLEATRSCERVRSPLRRSRRGRENNMCKYGSRERQHSLSGGATPHVSRGSSVSRTGSSRETPLQTDGTPRNHSRNYTDAPQHRYPRGENRRENLGRQKDTVLEENPSLERGSPLRRYRWSSRWRHRDVSVDSPHFHRLNRSRVSSPMRGGRARSSPGKDGSGSSRSMSPNSAPSTSSAPLTEQELLDEVQWKLKLLKHDIAEGDAERERAMMRSPFERLYHLNNRRDRDERRLKMSELDKLERIRDRIVSGSLEEEMKRREARLLKQEEMLTDPNSVFLRLYQHSHQRNASDAADADTTQGSARKGTDHDNSRTSVNATGHSSRPTSTTRSRLSQAESLAASARLYQGAVATQQKREGMARQSLEERQRFQVEELLVARLMGQIQLERARDAPYSKKPILTMPQLEEEARAQLEKLRVQDPEGYEKRLLKGRVLSKAEMDEHAARLWRHGFVSKEKLEAQKEAAELQSCTFQPVINDFFGSMRNTESNHALDSAAAEDFNNDNRPRTPTVRHPKHGEHDRCTQLYRRSVQAKERRAAMRSERDRAIRLQILRGRMANDHHFRRRVELDPSLANRFMKSLVV